MKKIGFLLLGLINNYNFTIITSCAYSLSSNKPYVNTSLIILFQIIPGFFTQLSYPYILYKIPYTFRWIFLLLTQLISSLILILSNDIKLILVSISIISINSYFGESSILSISSYYNKNELSLWIIGTGIAGIGGSGLYFLLNRFISEKIIFIINIFIYYILFCLGIYFLDYRKQIKTFSENKTTAIIIEKNIKETLPIINLDVNNKDLKKISENPLDLNIELEQIDLNTELDNTEIPLSEFTLDDGEKEQTSKELLHISLWYLFEIFLCSSSLCLAYFFGYLIRFAYVPLLFQSDFEYQLTQFITQIGIFIGRILGNYIKIERIKLFNLIHLYSLVLLVIGTVLIITKIYVYPIIVHILLFIMYFNNGLTYPLVYQYLYKKYEDNKEWIMGAVGQYTSFFMILGCITGYTLQIVMN